MQRETAYRVEVDVFRCTASEINEPIALNEALWIVVRLTVRVLLKCDSRFSDEAASDRRIALKKTSAHLS